MSEHKFDWQSRAEEASLIGEYREARSAKRTAGWFIVIGLSAGVLLTSLSLVLLLIGAAVAVWAFRWRRGAEQDIWRIWATLNELRTFASPECPMHGDLISMTPDPMGLSSVRLVGRVLDGDEHGGTAVVLSEPADGTEFVSKFERSFRLRRDDLAVYAMEGGEALIYDQVNPEAYAERWAPFAGPVGT